MFNTALYSFALFAGLEQETFECPVCLDDFPVDFAFRNSKCDECVLCRECARNHVLEEVAQSHIPARCAVCLGNGEATELSEVELLSLLTGEEQTMYHHRSRQLAVASAKDMVGCTQPDCNGVAEMVDGYKRFHCPACEHEHCTSCGVGWHDGLTCEQFQQWRRDEDAGDDLLAELMEKEGWKPCPNCGNGVEKTYGCNRMTCT